MKNSFQITAHNMFKEFAQSVQLEPTPLESKNGDEYSNFRNRTEITVYHSRLDRENEDYIEVAIGIENISEEYDIDDSIIIEWLKRVQNEVGHNAKAKTPMLWPRIGLHTTEEVAAFITELSNLFLGKRTFSENHLAAPPVEKHQVDEKVLQEILTRRGQREFRIKLLDTYRGTCAISGCTDTEVLEAAHIIPHSENASYLTSNGILLRADLHTLFDIFLISINPGNGAVSVSSSLSDFYQQYHGSHINLPESQEDRPSPAALMKHYKNTQMS